MELGNASNTANEGVFTNDVSYTELFGNIKNLIDNVRQEVVQHVNTAMVQAYWHIGEYIVQYEQKGNLHAEYGKRLLDSLSKDLTKQYGRGFGRSNVFTFRQFYLTYPKIQTLSGQLTWSHYLVMQYAMDGISNQLFAAKYQLYLPKREELQARLDTLLK